LPLASICMYNWSLHTWGHTICMFTLIWTTFSYIVVTKVERIFNGSHNFMVELWKLLRIIFRGFHKFTIPPDIFPNLEVFLKVFENQHIHIASIVTCHTSWYTNWFLKIHTKQQNLAPCVLAEKNKKILRINICGMSHIGLLYRYAKFWFFCLKTAIFQCFSAIPSRRWFPFNNDT